MGWMIYSSASSPQTREAERAEIIRIYTNMRADAPYTAECLMASKTGSVWYLAIKVSPKPGQKTVEPIDPGYIPDDDGAFVYAGVALTSRQNGEWGYKDMCESMGPNEAKAPLTLLDLLSPIQPENTRYAQDWRDRVRAYHAAQSATPKLQDGDIIEFDEPIKFTGGIEARRFKAFHHRRSTRSRTQLLYRTLDTQQAHTVRLSLKDLRGRNGRLIAPDGSTAQL